MIYNGVKEVTDGYWRVYIDGNRMATCESYDEAIGLFSMLKEEYK